MATLPKEIVDFLSSLSPEEQAQVRQKITENIRQSYVPEEIPPSKLEEYKQWVESLKPKATVEELLETQREQQRIAEELARSSKAAGKPVSSLGESASGLAKLRAKWAQSPELTSPARESARVFEEAPSSFPKSYAERIVEAASKPGRTAEQAAEVLAPKELPAVVSQAVDPRRAAAQAKAAAAAEGAISGEAVSIPSTLETLPAISNKNLPALIEASEKSPLLKTLLQKVGASGMLKYLGVAGALASEAPGIIEDIKNKEYRDAVEKAAGVAGGLEGAELGGTLGTVMGLETGPGAFVTGLGGATAGYVGGQHLAKGLASSALNAFLGEKKPPASSDLTQKKPDYEDDSNIQAQKMEERRMRNSNELPSSESLEEESVDVEPKEQQAVARAPSSRGQLPEAELLNNILQAQRRQEGQALGEAISRGFQKVAEGVSAKGAPLGYEGVKFDDPKFQEAIQKVTEKQLESAKSTYESFGLLKKQKEEADARDPNSEISKFFRDSYKSMGFDVPENASAYLLDKISPQASSYVKTKLAASEKEKQLGEKATAKQKQDAQKYLETAGTAIRGSRITEQKMAVDQAYEGVKNALENPSAVSDINVLYSTIKRFDPRSAVRPGEVELLQKALNAWERLKLKTSDFSNEKRVLDDDLVKDIKTLFEATKASWDRPYNNMVDIAVQNALNRGVDENMARMQLDVLNRDKILMAQKSSEQNQQPSEQKDPIAEFAKQNNMTYTQAANMLKERQRK